MAIAAAQPRRGFLRLTARVGGGLLLAGAGSLLVGRRAGVAAVLAQEPE